MIMSKLIIFVCVSNTCRSPMCEYMLRDILQKNGLDNEFTVSSRSITEDYEPENSPANERGIEVNFKTQIYSSVYLIVFFRL